MSFMANLIDPQPNAPSNVLSNSIQNQPYVVGLTGNIGTGKSTVLSYLATKGAYVLDADKIAHETMLPTGAAYQSVIDAYGTRGEIVANDGQIDRRALAAIVFADPEALAQLESIVLPKVFALTQQRIAECGSGIVILEAIKLLDGGKVVDLCDEIWVITAPSDAQFKRLQESRGMDEESIQQRLDAQSPQSEKVKRADRVIENDGTLAELHEKLDKIWSDLQSS